MTPFQSLVASLAVSGITDEATILAIAAERNIAVDPAPEAPAAEEEVA